MTPTPRARFAPSPSGRMHLGNLFAALLAWLDIRALGGEMLLRMNRIYDLLGMPDAGSCMRSLSEGEKEEWEFTDEMKNNQDTTLPAGTERMVSIQIQFRQHCSLQGFLICGKQKAGFRSALEMLYLLEDCLQEQDN